MTIAALTACVTADKGGNPRARCLQVLETEMRSTVNTNWVRIHAADALIEHFATAGAYNEYLPQAGVTTPQYRIGVWRVLAGACPTAKQKGEFATRIRNAMLDENGPDRLHAVETAGKLNLARVDEIPLLEKWAAAADEATAAFVRWTIALASSPATRPENEKKLAALLDSSDPVVRLRAAFGLRRLPHISPDSLARLEQLVQSEPADSIARAYIVAAAFFHTPEIKVSHAALKAQLLEYLAGGKPNEILEIAPIIGRRGTAADLPVLLNLLDHAEPDGRIGGAQGALHLLAK